MEPGWLRDVSPARWLVERLHGFAQDLGSFVPADFGAQARLFHPVVEHASPRAGRSHRWGEIAERNGRIAHREMQYHVISTPVGEALPTEASWPDGLEVGSLPQRERELLVEHLQDATTTSDRCWFCVWEGYGLDDEHHFGRVQLPGRTHLLAAGPIQRAIESFRQPPWDQSANIWWPDDRAWVVATEIDFAWTYIAATREVVAALVNDDRLEVFEAQLTDGFTLAADQLNRSL